MALIESYHTSNLFSCDGVQSVFNFSFLGGYIDRGHVKAKYTEPSGSTSEIPVSQAMFVGPYQLAFNPAPSAGGILNIYRETPSGIPLVDFADGAKISEASLDTVAKQSLFVAAESNDTAVSALRVPEPSGISMLPNVEGRKLRLVGMDGAGNPIMVTPDGGSGTALALDLADNTNTAKGSALVRHGALLNTADYSLARAVNDYGRILQGADPTGAAVSTLAFRNLLNFCIPRGLKATLPAGNYTVDGAVTDNVLLPQGSLHLHCVGNVTINVLGSSVPFERLISCETTAANSVVITGGTLTINCNNKVASPIYARHYGQGGQVNIENLKITNCKNVNFGVENGGLYLYGRWSTGTLGVIEVDGVDRTGAGTASRGVLIAEAGGPFTIDSLRVARVLATGFTADADGLYFSGFTTGASTTQREGGLTVSRAYFEDCQGRSMKFQHQDVVVQDCIINRQNVSTFDVPDVDFQLGGGHIDRLILQYRKNGSTSPLHAQFYPIASQHACTNRATTCRVGSVTLRSEVQLPRFMQVVVGAGALDASTHIEGVDLIPYGSFTGGFFSRCAVEFDAGQVAASSNKTFISARNIRGDMTGVPVVGHTSFGASVAGKLSIEVVDNTNTGVASSATKVVGATSSGEIPAFAQFKFRGNVGIHSLMMSTFTFDTQALADGCTFSYVRATATVTNGPTITAGTYVDVECLGSINGTSRKVRMTVDDAGTMGEWYTQSGTWGVIK